MHSFSGMRTIGMSKPILARSDGRLGYLLSRNTIETVPIDPSLKKPIHSIEVCLKTIGM